MLKYKGGKPTDFMDASSDHYKNIEQQNHLDMLEAFKDWQDSCPTENDIPDLQDMSEKDKNDALRALRTTHQGVIHPRALARLIMNSMGSTNETGTMPVDQKHYWLEVAEYMGPDWAQEFYAVSKFVTKVA